MSDTPSQTVRWRMVGPPHSPGVVLIFFLFEPECETTSGRLARIMVNQSFGQCQGTEDDGNRGHWRIPPVKQREGPLPWPLLGTIRFTPCDRTECGTILFAAAR